MIRTLKEVSVGDILGDDSPSGIGNGGRNNMAKALNIVRQYPDGTTVKVVSESLSISLNGTRDILHELENMREIYSRKIPGIKGTLYYPNGKLIHKFLQETREYDQEIFRISIHDGKRKPRIQIQERKFSLLDGETIQGSIYIDLDHAPELASFIMEMLKKFNMFEENRNIVTR